MYIKRTIEQTLLLASKSFKVVIITGARQVGKSTLLKKCDPKRTYVTLDDYRLKEMAINEPQLFLSRFPSPLIIDEIQMAPNLLPYIKMIVDKSDKKGEYWLSGSNHFSMMKNVSESLAGRAAILDLKGFSLKELDGTFCSPFLPTAEYIKSAFNDSKIHTSEDIFKKIWLGSYPELYTNKNMEWEIFYRSYIQTYIEKDIKTLNAIRNEMDFLKFLQVLASRTGQMLNYTDIASEIGVAVTTIKSWVSILVSSDIVYLLEPYYSNINKRMVKTPKVYFQDTGLCAYLTRWDNYKVLSSGAMNGAFFETFVVNEIVKSYVHNGKKAPLYFYRDKEKREIDVIIEQNGLLYPVEIKMTTSPKKEMIKNFSILPKEKLGMGAIISLNTEWLPLTDSVNIIPVSYI